MVAAYRHKDRSAGRVQMGKVITAQTTGAPADLPELGKLGRTMSQRAVDVLAFSDRPGTSNAPTEAINGRLERLPGTALGLRHLSNYIARSLLEAGGFRPRPHPQMR